MDQPVPEFGQEIAQDASPLCPQCLRPCDPLDYYCPHCGSNETINPLTPYISFVNIRYNVGICGKLWNRCWYDNETALWKKILYFFLLFFWFPIIVVMIPYYFIEKIKSDKSRIQLEKAYNIFLILTLIAIVFGLLSFVILEVYFG